MADKKWITIMGSFVADLAFRTPDLPRWGETILGSAFSLGPGGKGSNQAVAAVRLGARVSFVGKLGRDAFGDLARRLYDDEGVDRRFCLETAEHATGGAAIILHEGRGENAIVVVPGACFTLTPEEVDGAASLIRQSAVFVTQLELPVPTVLRGLELARAAGATTILNPAPATSLPAEIFPLCDYFTPNETEAAALAGHPVATPADAGHAAEAFLARGVRNVVVTLGENGALVANRRFMEHVPAFYAGPVAETTGAGDAFNGGLAVGIAEGLDLVEATRLGCAAAALSVTRAGTALSMPRRAEVDELLKRG